MKLTTRINSADCPVRITSLAKPYGFKTIGSFYKFVRKCDPNAKLYFGTTHMRAVHVLRVMDKYLGIDDLSLF
jgi:hypothetical protein